MPTDEDGDGIIDHFTVAVESGIGGDELLAMNRLITIRSRGGEVALRMLLMWIEFPGRPHDMSAPLGEKARIWRAVTPFIPTRHYKKRGSKKDVCAMEDFAEVVLREELARRGFPEPSAAHPLPRCELWDHQKRTTTGRSLSWLEFRRERVYGAGRKGLHPGGGFVIHFPEPVQGPIAVGYGCHFGLGLFAPAE
jgi:CRISPR-associated protein Csb2